MRRLGPGRLTRKNNEGRVWLSPRDPRIETLLAGIWFDGINMEELRAICKSLTRDRNRWDIGRRSRGLFSGRIKLTDADAILKSELERLKEGVE